MPRGVPTEGITVSTVTSHHQPSWAAGSLQGPVVTNPAVPQNCCRTLSEKHRGSAAARGKGTCTWIQLHRREGQEALGWGRACLGPAAAPALTYC